MQRFRDGGYNTLVATCVGEEGLDIGEVDLIICFDAAKSPIRLVQRMGRTGRKRSGRIVILVAAGKEEYTYRKSQSSKTSIHRAIDEGCKKLKLYQHCPRMVPRHIHPQVHKMHMTTEKFVSKKVARKLSNGKLKSGASRIKCSEAMFLNQQQLSCWGKELALSDPDFRAIEKSVGRCLSSKSSFMSIDSLKNGKRQNFSPLDSSFSGFGDMHRKKSNTQLSARGKNKFSLDLGKWTYLQTASTPTKLIGHSSRSYALMSILEFADLLQTNDGMGENYDLEMRTYLNEEDIKFSSLDDVHPKNAWDEGARPRKVDDKHRAFLDLSSDEDFKVSTVEKGVVSAPQTDKVVNVSTPQDLTASGCDANECFGDKNLSCCRSHGTHRKLNGDSDPPKCVYLTASQHMVPRAPDVDCLSWLDEIEPSQTQVDHPDLDLSPTDDVVAGRRRGGGIKAADAFPDEEFHFITPKDPPCRKRRTLSTSTPKDSSSKVLTRTARRRLCESPVGAMAEMKTDRCSESIDLFDDLSLRDICDEFSASGLQGMQKRECLSEGTVKVTSKVGGDFERLMESEDISIPPQGLCLTEKDGIVEEDEVEEEEKEAGMTVGDELMDIFDISEIAESDFEQLADEDKSRAAVVDKGCSLVATSAAADGACEDIQQDSSYPLHVGKRKRRRHKMVPFLDSPSSSSLLEGGKENRMSEESMEDASPSTRFTASLWVTSSCGPEHKGSENVSPVVLDSSEEDDNLPLMKRLKWSRRNTETRKKQCGVVYQKPSEFMEDEIKASSAEEKGKKLLGEEDYDYDDLPLMKRLERNRRNIETRKKRCGMLCQKPSEFMENEAKASSAEEEDGEPVEGEDDYDIDDSFINDNSMLTQYTQKRSHKIISSINTHDSSNEVVNPYPPNSQRDDIFTRRTCHASRSRFRMVFSQRYHMLQHYMDKADGAEKYSWQKLQVKQVKNRSVQFCGSSGSEAEEVNMPYGEDEEWDELSRSLLEMEESEMAELQEDATPGSCGGGRGGGRTGQDGRHKRRAQFLSDSEEEVEELTHCTRTEDRLTGNLEAGCQETEKMEEQEKYVRFMDITRFQDTVISPSLLVRFYLRNSRWISSPFIPINFFLTCFVCVLTERCGDSSNSSVFLPRPGRLAH